MTCLLIFINREDLIQSLQFLLHVKQLRVQGYGKTEQLLSISQLLTLLFKITELLFESLQKFHTWKETQQWNLVPLNSQLSAVASWLAFDSRSSCSSSSSGRGDCQELLGLFVFLRRHSASLHQEYKWVQATLMLVMWLESHPGKYS